MPRRTPPMQRRLTGRASAVVTRRPCRPSTRSMLLVAAVGLAVLAGESARQVALGGALVAADAVIGELVAPYRSAALLQAFGWITLLGSGEAVVVGGTLLTALLWLRGRALIVPFWLTLAGAGLTTWAGKHLVGRPRPSWVEGVAAPSLSFPSSHATAAVVLYGFCAYAMVRLAPSARARCAGIWSAALFVVLVGVSRVFLGLHHASDVLGGILVGSFWLMVALQATAGDNASQLDRRQRHPS